MRSFVESSRARVILMMVMAVHVISFGSVVALNLQQQNDKSSQHQGVSTKSVGILNNSKPRFLSQTQDINNNDEEEEETSYQFELSSTSSNRFNKPKTTKYNKIQYRKMQKASVTKATKATKTPTAYLTPSKAGKASKTTAPIPTPSPAPSPEVIAPFSINPPVPTPNSCEGVNCPTGEKCDPSDGQCKPLSQLRTCVAVIDEVDCYSDQYIDQLWSNFRTKYPDRPFCLLQPQIPNTGYDPLHRPAAFDSDPLTTFAVVNRDDQTNVASDWFTICGIDSSLDFVALFIDDSGSMYVSTVALSLQQFETTVANAGLALCSVFNFLEDWITPFDIELSNYDPETGFCSG